MILDINYLNEFIDDFPVGIGRSDITGKLPNSSNKFFLEMFGWEASDIDTMDKWFLKAYPDEKYRNHVLQLWQDRIDQTEAQGKYYSEPMNVKVTCKDGSIKWCEARYYRLENFIYGIFIDITHQKKIEQELISISLIDELTQTNNRKSYNKRISESISLYNRYKTPFSILMYDIDDFKHINDTYGHNIGDKVLIEMSNFVKTLIRENDYLFRVGGEEFIIILSDTNIEEGKFVSEKICKEVSELQMVEGEKITISIGLTEVESGDTEDSIYKKVDSLLYFSKKNGKNRVST